ncbi:response regulator transcription factor [Sphingobacterium sp. DN00404]|uniref:Response regulator transcription factor n=1 Tax=Sphingobacterium micropteri TaxID=2763501 RepID=A0ABR7YJZ7_9SPHI|nr:LytTR family DNA-binding domain-containing protein [Sphingobacterium micropteri]MBD1431634.1 response regulator transcription factor [Sphingobacterium micropteri]
MKKVIIIEDEPAAVKELKTLIEQEEDFQFLGHAGSLEDALKLIREQQPDLVFMDINLYDCLAFDILNELEHLPKHVIFVTAYNQYAIKAIKYGALDYLLKPIDEQEFKEAITRFRNQQESVGIKEQLSLTENNLQHNRTPRHIALPALGQVRIVPLTDIRYCQGDGPYTHFFLVSGKKETVSKPLKFYETLLPEHEFIRTHQSYIVHIPFVKSILKHASILMDGNEEIPISYRRKNDIMAKLIR